MMKYLWAAILLTIGSSVNALEVRVAVAGSGSGSVSSTAPGMWVNGIVSRVPVNVGASVTLSASPNAGSSFVGWAGGGCSGTGSCTVSVNSNTEITAYFNSNSGRNFYIDYGGGDNSKAGTSLSTAWKVAPGMPGCTGSCGSYSHLTGDKFIFKGGVTWPATALPLQAKTSGSSSVPDYYGVDGSWFDAAVCGSSFCRPIFDNQGTDNGFFNSYDYVTHEAQHNITLDSVEMTGLRWSGTGAVYIGVGSSNGIIIKNGYFHNWSHVGTPVYSPAGCPTEGVCSCVGGVCDQLFIVVGTCLAGTGNVMDNCIIDGAPNGTDSGMATYHFSVVRNSVARNMANGFLPGQTGGNDEVSGSIIGPINNSFDRSQHENGIEETCTPNTIKIFNNIVRDIHVGVALLEGWAHADYIYNNIIYNTQPPPIGMTGGSAKIYNNIIDATGSTEKYHCVHALENPTLDVRNNLCISEGGLVAGTYSGSAANNNVLLTSAQAAAEGLTSANLYRPASQSASVINKGGNLTNIDTVNMPFLNRDISGIARPASGPWEIGSYEFNGGTPPGNPHPADTNSDFLMALNEATKYGACWKNPAAFGDCQTGIAIDYAVRAGTLWAGSATGQYQYNSVNTCPLCWEVKP